MFEPLEKDQTRVLLVPITSWQDLSKAMVRAIQPHLKDGESVPNPLPYFYMPLKLKHLLMFLGAMLLKHSRLTENISTRMLIRLGQVGSDAITGAAKRGLGKTIVFLLNFGQPGPLELYITISSSMAYGLEVSQQVFSGRLAEVDVVQSETAKILPTLQNGGVVEMILQPRQENILEHADVRCHAPQQ